MRIMDRWCHSPAQTLALFPAWYCPAQPDWPDAVEQIDFPWFDAGGLDPPAVGLAEFLAAGEPPIVFTPGTAQQDAPEFFAESARACERLGCRGVFLTRFRAQLPSALPSGIRHFEHAPFGALLPRALAFVHHGGIGTVAQALRAGVPQLAMPCGFDQFDNSERMRRLGAGLVLPRDEYRGDAVTAALERLRSDAAWRVRCRALAELVRAGGGLGATADALERRWCRSTAEVSARSGADPGNRDAAR